MVKHKDLKTGFLFATPSVIAGVARLLDLWGVFDRYNTADSEEEADAFALYSDWRIVGQDLRDAMNDFGVNCYEGGTIPEENSESKIVGASGVGQTLCCCHCGDSIGNLSAMIQGQGGMAPVLNPYSFSMWPKPKPDLGRWRCVGSTPTTLDKSVVFENFPNKTGKSLE